MSLAMHSLKKFMSTLRIAATLILARTFGEYKHSGYADGFWYARYEWRGEEWAFPTDPIETEQTGS